MRKPTLFISAALTAFMLAVLFGVVSAYQNIVNPTERQTAQNDQTVPVVQIAQPSADQPAEIQNQVPEQAPTQIPAATQAASITPEEAAGIASKVMGKTDLYSVELTQFESADAYLVTFTSGDLVYVGLDGQILSISKIKVTVVNTSNRRNNNNDDNSGNSGSTSTGGSEHETEHEGGDD